MKVHQNLGYRGSLCWHAIWSAVCIVVVIYVYVIVTVAMSNRDTDDYIPQHAPRKLDDSDPELFKTQDDIFRYYDQRMRLLTDVISLWPPEQAGSTPKGWVDTVPRFDWLNETSRAAALRVRQAERPFILRNVPSVLDANVKWTDDYLAQKFGNKKGKVEKSETNSFMFWRGKKAKKNKKGATEWLQMSWNAFRDIALRIDITNKPTEPHYYWHAHGIGNDKWIEDDLKLFDKENSFFIVDRKEYTVPIACRVGTKGLCNENHYDTHRTFSAQIVGSKRWIFMPPSMCSKLYLYPPSHMSARHSAVGINTGHIDESKYPLALEAFAIDTVVHAGEVAYLPSNWFHHIISQEFNIQCIARSGHSVLGNDDIRTCGFKV